MSELDKALVGLAESLERFGKAVDAYIPILIRKRQAAEQRRKMVEEANARAAVERKEFIEKYAPKVQAMWELVVSKFGRTH